MLISFFEEFPTKESLKKISIISWPSKLYIAAKSLKEFQEISSSIKNKNIREIIYWPILEKKEGYWVSPFSKNPALRRVFSELSKETPVMLDLELPTTRNPWLYITEAVRVAKNKEVIAGVIQKQEMVCLAEYSSSSRLLALMGLHYNAPHAKIIKMFYHSMHHFSEGFLIRKIRLNKKEFGKRFILALGTIAQGIEGTEPILSKRQLEKDLAIAKTEGIKEVVLFRLGGLTKEYAKIFKKFA